MATCYLFIGEKQHVKNLDNFDNWPTALIRCTDKRLNNLGLVRMISRIVHHNYRLWQYCFFCTMQAWGEVLLINSFPSKSTATILFVTRSLKYKKWEEMKVTIIKITMSNIMNSVVKKVPVNFLLSFFHEYVQIIFLNQFCKLCEWIQHTVSCSKQIFKSPKCKINAILN